MQTKPHLIAAQSNAKPLKVLMVDDELASLVVGKVILENYQFDVTLASDGLEALSFATQQNFDAIILDAQMPQLNGFDSCKQLRETINKNTYIIIATGLSHKNAIEQAFECGADDFITKPVNYHVLASRLQKIVSIQGNHQEKSQAITDTLTSTNECIAIITEGRNLKWSQPVPKDYELLSSQVFSLSQLVEYSDAIQFLSPDECIEHLLNEGISIRHPVSRLKLSAKIYSCEVKNQQFLLLNHLSSEVDTQFNVTDDRSVDNETGYLSRTCLINTLATIDYEKNQHRKNMALARVCFGSSNTMDQGIKRNSQINALIHTIEKLTNCGPIQLKDSLVFRTDFNEVTLMLKNISPEEIERHLTKHLAEVKASAKLNSNDFTIAYKVYISHSLNSIFSASEHLGILDYMSSTYKNDPRKIIFFDDAIQNNMVRRSTIAKLLLRDIHTKSFSVYFQPKFNTYNLNLTGMEALVRWETKELGFISPAEFIPISVSLDLINQLSLLVIEKTVSQIKKWLELGIDVVPVSVNLDTNNLNHHAFVDEFVSIIDSAGIDHSLIEVEVTENVMVDKESQAMESLLLLKQHGFKVAMDDFGTGYSSFSYLQHLPIDTLKIDISFVRKIDSDTTAQAIAKAIVSLGHEVGLSVIAEGVENKEQLDKLLEYNCDNVQGYLTGRPECADEAIRFFKRKKIA